MSAPHPPPTHGCPRVPFTRTHPVGSASSHHVIVWTSGPRHRDSPGGQDLAGPGGPSQLVPRLPLSFPLLPTASASQLFIIVIISLDFRRKGEGDMETPMTGKSQG